MSEEQLQKANERLRKENNRLYKTVDTEKDRTERLLAAMQTAISSGLEDLKFEKIEKPERDPRRIKEEVAVAVLADWQLAKVTSSYNTKIAEKRIEQYGDDVIKITNIQRADHPVRKLQVWALGDIVEGELIFEGQSHLTDASLYRQVTVDGPRIMGNFLRKMLENFDEVKVHWVIGNHGRLGGRAHKEYNPETNADRMLGRIMSLIFANEPRISWSIPEGLEDSWYDIANIGGYRTLLIHGDQIPGGLQTQNGMQKKVLGWKAGALPESFNDVYLGHYHHPMLWTFNDVYVRVSGSPESDNGFARKIMASVSQASQPLMFVLPGVGPTAEYRVRLK